MDKNYIHNTGSSYFDFYFYKFGYLFLGVIWAIFAYDAYNADGQLFFIRASFSFIVLVLSDAVVVPVARKGGLITFHHLWRQSRVYPSKIRLLFLSSGGRFKSNRKLKLRLFAFFGPHFWNFYIGVCDIENDLATDLEEKTNCKIISI
ncbi:hypothetical protein [Pseudodesulfovibrio profundus]|uniref:hypothetical protein n=1 Tax=Pseudodesulfovibrio profundus TaxID=57320 RepID=UPI000BE411F0|nr:hypothetical protein [Pseudodesulfovibrio profundus]